MSIFVTEERSYISLYTSAQQFLCFFDVDELKKEDIESLKKLGGKPFKSLSDTAFSIKTPDLLIKIIKSGNDIHIGEFSNDKIYRYIHYNDTTQKMQKVYFESFYNSKGFVETQHVYLNDESLCVHRCPTQPHVTLYQSEEENNSFSFHTRLGREIKPAEQRILDKFYIENPYLDQAWEEFPCTCEAFEEYFYSNPSSEKTKTSYSGLLILGAVLALGASDNGSAHASSQQAVEQAGLIPSSQDKMTSCIPHQTQPTYEQAVLALGASDNGSAHASSQQAVEQAVLTPGARNMTVDHLGHQVAEKAAIILHSYQRTIG